MTRVYRSTGDDVGFGRHAAGGGLVAWYVANCANCTALTSGILTGAILHALPFTSPWRGGVLDRMGLYVTVGAAGLIRLGVYKATSPQNLYPGDLIVDAGQVDTTVLGAKTLTINTQLAVGATYWAVCLATLGDPGSGTINCLAVGGCGQVLGHDPGFGVNPYTHLEVAQAFGALPATFPAGGALQWTAPIPALYMRFSS